jgi:hypothetical protein
MTPEQQAAFIMAQSACAMAEIAGMQAENQHRAANGDPLMYREDAFNAVILRNGIGHNDVLGFFRGTL